MTKSQFKLGKKLSILTLSLCSSSIQAAWDQTHIDYCHMLSGKVEDMKMIYHTSKGYIKGRSEKFCTFNIDKGFIVVGLETFASVTPSIAATFIKSMPRLDMDSKLFKGPFDNPSMNFCKNIGGSNVLFNVAGGGYSNHLGESDVCIFGDNSMVSAWSLIYIANGRKGYDKVKEATRAEPLPIPIPE